MEYTTLGSTGMTVSRICIGCGRFGRDDDAKLGDDVAAELVDRAVELGVNFFDTANVYSGGDSEEILGDALAGYDRDRLVVATKVFFRTREDDPNSGGLSRKTVEGELARSLDRLGMDTVDLYQTHRWDDDTPIEETLRALDDAVRRGQVRYVGGSSMFAYQFADALHTSDALGVERFQTMQNHYNLVYREEEREMLPLCEKEGVGVIPWSPLARGFLARPREEMAATIRGEQVADSDRQAVYRSNGGEEINDRLQQVAADHGVSMAQVALAWLLEQDAVDAPIVGCSSVEHLEEAVEAVDLSIPESDFEYLEAPYEPKSVTGHS
jgi:aryl-alcohol dehydrogenase-like predicted oxidoreductase